MAVGHEMPSPDFVAVCLQIPIAGKQWQGEGCLSLLFGGFPEAVGGRTLWATGCTVNHSGKYCSFDSVFVLACFYFGISPVFQCIAILNFLNG